MIVTLIGIPWAKSAFVMGQFAFFPFGKEAISRHALTGANDVGTGFWGKLGNIVWFLLAGVWLALGHAFLGVACCCTLIGIPFGIQHFKLAGLALSPIGKQIVTKEVAELVRKENAALTLASLRG